MNIRVRLKDRSNKEGKNLIMFYIHLNGQRKALSTEIAIHPESWDKRREEIKQSKRQFNRKFLNENLIAKKELLIGIHERNQKLTLAEVITEYQYELKGRPKSKEPIGLLEFFDHYKSVYRNIKSPNTLRKGDQVKLHLQDMMPNIRWESLTHSFWNTYCNFLIDKHKLSGSTIDRHGTEIKIRCKEALKMFPDIKITRDYESFSFKSNATQQFWATWEEVKGIEQAHTITKAEEHVKDGFIFTCYTGLRNSDSRINKSNIFKEKGRYYLRVVVEKTGFDYNIPLSQQAIDILIKYDYQIPEHAQSTYNLYIKNIAQRVKQSRKPYIKYWYIGREKKSKEVMRSKMFSTHTARRTFARHWLNKGGSLIVLSKILGHSSTDQTLTYVGYTPEEVRDEFLKVFG